MSCFAHLGEDLYHKPAHQTFADAHVLDRQPRSDLAEPGGDIFNPAHDEPLPQTTIPQIETLGINRNPYPSRPQNSDSQAMKLILIIVQTIPPLLISPIDGQNIRVENARDS